MPLLDVNKFIEFAFENIPIPLKMFLSALNKFANGLLTSFSLASSFLSAPSASSPEGFYRLKNAYKLLGFIELESYLGFSLF